MIEMTRCTKHVLSNRWMTCQPTLPCFLKGEACHIMGVHLHIFEKSSMFNLFLSLQNLFSSSGLVKISASWSSVLTLLMQMLSFYWWSLMKLWQTSMCFVLACWTGLLVSFTTLSLLHSNGTCLNLIPKSFKVASIQRICAQQLLAAMYSASAVETAILLCFFDD
jgi:hypothetical protein